MENNENIFLGLDIGTTQVCAVICELKKNNDLQLLGAGTSISAGIFEKDSLDIEELTASIKKAIERAEKEVGIKVKKCCVTVPSCWLSFIHNSGMLVSKNESGQISLEEKNECVQRSKNLACSIDKTLIHAIALQYKVEDNIVENPIGVFGKRLEALSHLVFSNKNYLEQLLASLKKLGLFINGMMFDSLAMSAGLLSEKEQKHGSIILDFGATSTKISFIKNNLLNQSLVVPIGSHSLSKDIVTCLKVSYPEAERLKILYGNVFLTTVNPEETVEITTLDEGKKYIKVQLLCQIVEARIREICLHCIKKFPLITEDQYPLVLAGGGALLKGFLPFCQKHLNGSAREGINENMNQNIESSMYAVAIGTILYGIERKAVEYVKPKNIFYNRCKQLVLNVVK